jgi:hypothetical protein
VVQRPDLGSESVAPLAFCEGARERGIEMDQQRRGQVAAVVAPLDDGVVVAELPQFGRREVGPAARDQPPAHALLPALIYPTVTAAAVMAVPAALVVALAAPAAGGL